MFRLDLKFTGNRRQPAQTGLTFIRERNPLFSEIYAIRYSAVSIADPLRHHWWRVLMEAVATSDTKGDYRVADAKWNLASVNLTLNLTIKESTLTGSIIYPETTYTVQGGWDAANPKIVPGRNYSAFSLFGYNLNANDQYWIAASGIMSGSGAAPTQIRIKGTVSSSSTGKFENFDETLVPVAVVDITQNSNVLNAPRVPEIGHLQNYKAVQWSNSVTLDGGLGEAVYITPGGLDDPNPWKWNQYFSNGPSESNQLEVPKQGLSKAIVWNKVKRASPVRKDLHYSVSSKKKARWSFDVDPEMYVDEC